MARREREILERAVHTIAEQATKADAIVDEAIDVGHGRSDPLVTHAKMLRLELLNVKADLERELEDFVLNSRGAASTFTGLGARDHARPLGASGASAPR